MTIEQMNNFLVLEKHMHFSLAADSLFISQSSLSKQIKALEKELGITLFERNTRNIELTEAGKLFSGYAHEMVDSYNRMQKTLRQYLEHMDNCLRIFSIPVLNQYNITNLLSDYKKMHADADISVSEVEETSAVTALFNHECELIIVRSQTIPQNNVKVFPLTEDELVLIAHRDNPITQNPRMPILRAAGESFFLLGRSTGLYDISCRVCEEGGFTPQISGDALRLESIRSFVSLNMGVSLVMKKMAQFIAREDENIRIIELEEKPLLTLDIVTREEPLSQIVLQFIAAAKKFFVE